MSLCLLMTGCSVAFLGDNLYSLVCDLPWIQLFSHQLPIGYAQTEGSEFGMGGMYLRNFDSV